MATICLGVSVVYIKKYLQKSVCWGGGGGGGGMSQVLVFAEYLDMKDIF